MRLDVLSPVGEFVNFDLQGWDLDGSAVFATDVLPDRTLWKRLDLRGVTKTDTGPERILDTDIATLTSWGHGPRALSVLAIVPTDDGRVRRMGVLDTETLAFEPCEIAAGGNASFCDGGFLPDGKRALVVDGTSVVVYDTAAKRARRIAGCAAADGLLVSHDGRTLVVIREVYDGDVWLGVQR